MTASRTAGKIGVVDSVEAGGFILAGGRSRRMGQEKALLQFQGSTLIERAVATMREAAKRVWIVGGPADLARYAPVIGDRQPRFGESGCASEANPAFGPRPNLAGGWGPLAGIEAALAESPYDLNLFVPVDTPFVPAHLLRWMLRRAAGSGAVATIPVAAGRPQPLIAVYSRRLLFGLTRSIQVGRLRTLDAVMTAASEHGGADLFRVEMMKTIVPRSGDDHPETYRGTGTHINITDWFVNLNTPADLSRVLHASDSRPVRTVA